MQVGLPMMIFCVGGSFGLAELMQTKQELGASNVDRKATVRGAPT
jgi:hypothetical protein